MEEDFFVGVSSAVARVVKELVKNTRVHFCAYVSEIRSDFVSKDRLIVLTETKVYTLKKRFLGRLKTKRVVALERLVGLVLNTTESTLILKEVSNEYCFQGTLLHSFAMALQSVRPSLSMLTLCPSRPPRIPCLHNNPRLSSWWGLFSC